MPWTDDMVATAIQMAEEEKASASQIAAVLGVTRSALIGKLNRIGKGLSTLNGYEGGRMMRPGAPRKTRVKRTYTEVRMVGNRRVKETVTVVEVKENPALAALMVEREKGVKLVDLEDRHCRWPHGSEDVWYCGRDKAEGSSYCDGHRWHSGKSSEVT